MSRKFLIPLAKRRRMTPSGTSCPPCRTRIATRAIASSALFSERKKSFTENPAARHFGIRWRYVCPDNVVSNAKLRPALKLRSISSSINLPARIAAVSG
jgi:hypothetical protein